MSTTREPSAVPDPDGEPGQVFDRHLVIEQLGGWRGMLDATLPTVAFIVANGLWGLRIGIWSALGAALLIFVLRLVRRESVQQAVSGLIGVGIAVAIAAASGQARDFFVIGILRSLAVGVVLLGSILVRRPLVGVVAEFLAPSHLGTMASHSMPLFRRRPDPVPPSAVPDGPREPDPDAEQHWRDDPRLLRAYSWLTVMWGATFLLRALVQYVFYRADEVEILGTMSLLLGLPVTAVELLVTLWVVARLHQHRSAQPAPGDTPPSPA